MAPKKGAKKGKKNESDDEKWAAMEAKFEDPLAEASQGEESDGGGLMAALAATKKNKKKAKPAPPPASSFAGLMDDEDEDEDDGNVEQEPAPKDEDIEPQFAPKAASSKKDKKKGKKNKKGGDDDDDFDAIVGQVKDVSINDAPEERLKSPASEAPASQDAGEPDGAEGGGEFRVLSKREKEKLKKEKEKAKKKAQAAAKKEKAPSKTVESEAASPVVEQSPKESLAGEPEEDTSLKEDAPSSKKDSKKKKKGKGGAAAAPPAEEEPPAAPAGKPKGKLAQIQALYEAQRRAQEEQQRAAEEEQRRIEEEERRAAEAEKEAEEAKARKREKERQKKEQLKKEGKYLTAKQRAERAAAEARRKALLERGAVQQRSQPSKSAAAEAEEARVAAEEAAKTKAAEEAKAKAAAEAEAAKAAKKNEVKDSWDDSDSDVKESWEDSDDNEEPEAAKEDAKEAPKEVRKAETPAESESESETESGSDESSDESSEEDSSDESSDDDQQLTSTQRQEIARREAARERRLQREEEARQARSKDNMRSPIGVILGHVDTGKTKLLDQIRKSHVQEGEAGGITQQIGATFFPMESIRTKTKVLGDRDLPEYKLPGLLMIDTPGHESFTNLRSRGQSLCNIAVLVVDIMHGLEQQTLESIQLLKSGKTPFIVALNKVDRLYGWQSHPGMGFLESFKTQNTAVKREFESRLTAIKTLFAEQGFNAYPYYENDNLGRNVSLVPTSAVTGEGVPDLLMLLVKLTQERMVSSLMYLSTLEATVLEVKVIEGHGTTIDVVLSNGVLHEGDRIVVAGTNGAIVTQVRALLTPQPMKELRIKGQYVHHKFVKAALGVKIVAQDLEKAIAGSRLLVVNEDDDVDELKEDVMGDLTDLMSFVDKTGKGVNVQASTIGSLEALLEFLKQSKIPVSSINIGPVHKKDVMRSAYMLEKAPEFAVMLCFDVPVEKEAEAVAKEYNVKIFKADVIYHLFDAFTAYSEQVKEARKQAAAPSAVWPVRLKVHHVFAKRDPIILGCDVIDGSLHVGTPLCVVRTEPSAQGTNRTIVNLGKVTSIEHNHNPLQVVKKGQGAGGVAVKIEPGINEQAKVYGRHFTEKDEVISMISRQSIDVLKDVFRADVPKDDWVLIKMLKVKLGIP